jgi:transposase
MTPEEAQQIYCAGPAAVLTALLNLDAQVTAFQAQVDELTAQIARLSKTSANSSKRPSSDDLTKPPPPKQPPGARGIGGQPGHPRHERPAFPPGTAIQHHEHQLHDCPDCQGEVIFTGGPPRLIQQIEIPADFLQRQEHVAYPYWCARCQKLHYAPFPPEVVKEGLFKQRLTALVAYLKYVDHASFSTIRKFIRDVLGEKVSRGYLRKVIGKVDASLGQTYQQLLERLPLEPILNVDETGHKENGRKFWTWVFKAELYVLFHIDASRGSQVLVDKLGEEFRGILGCDYFSAYRKYMGDFGVSVQFCLAHLIRDLRFLTDLPDAATRAYGQRLLEAVKQLFQVFHEQENFSPTAFAEALRQRRQQILAVALHETPSRLNAQGKELCREAQNMARRFRLHGAAYFQFITTPQIDPTNNLAEQAIRFVVIDRHITQGTRSAKGRQTCQRLWTVIATCALQGRSAFEFILQAVQTYFRGEPAPSLLTAPT